MPSSYLQQQRLPGKGVRDKPPHHQQRQTKPLEEKTNTKTVTKTRKKRRLTYHRATTSCQQAVHTSVVRSGGPPGLPWAYPPGFQPSLLPNEIRIEAFLIVVVETCPPCHHYFDDFVLSSYLVYTPTVRVSSRLTRYPTHLHSRLTFLLHTQASLSPPPPAPLLFRL